MELNKVLQYLKEGINDISTERRLYHYTNLPALMEIIKSGGLIGGRNFATLNGTKEESENYRDKKLTSVKELCATRKDMKCNPKGKRFSDNTDNVKITLYVDRINSGVRGVKKPSAYDLFRKMNRESYEQINRKFDDEKDEFEGYRNANRIFKSKPLRWWLDNLSASKRRLVNLKSHGITEKDLSDEALKFIRDNSKPAWYDWNVGGVIAFIKLKYVFDEKLAPDNNPQEERFLMGDSKIPLDPRFMKIEFVGKPSPKSFTENRTNYHTGDLKPYDINYKDMIDVIGKLPPDLLVRNEGYEATMRSLKAYASRKKKAT